MSRGSRTARMKGKSESPLGCHWAEMMASQAENGEERDQDTASEE